MKNQIIAIVSATALLSGCSVYKAASNEGVKVGDIKKCKDKGCLLSKGMNIITKGKDEQGNYTETYRAVARKSGMSYGRAAGHAVLDVCTLGLWEVAGTPIEGAMSNNRGHIVAHATYPSKEAQTFTNIKIYDQNGKAVN